MKLDFLTLQKAIDEMYTLGLEDLLLKEPEELSPEEDKRIESRLKEIDDFVVKSGWTSEEFQEAELNQFNEKWIKIMENFN